MAQTGTSAPRGDFVELEGETYYRISAFHRLAPFLMIVPSDTDLWMFLASGGGLTAGRVDADGSLFPYQTVDQLHDAHHHSGPITLIRVEGGADDRELWEPFAPSNDDNPQISRSLYKNTTGNRVIFEEIHHGLGLAYRYRWSASDEFGWVKSSTLENRSAGPMQLSLLDGLRNVLPYGAPLGLYQQSSNLVDAYKKSELDAESGLGIFSLSSRITDRTEALEVLRANTVWSCGLGKFRVHLSLSALDAFRSGRVLPSESVINGRRGNYLVSSGLMLEAGESSHWHVAGDIGRDHVQITELRHRLLEDRDLGASIELSLWNAGENLRQNVGSADGLQITGRPESWSHHFANVLYNNMRGGVFLRNYEIPVSDFACFLSTRNQLVAEKRRADLEDLPERVNAMDLLRLAKQTGDVNFERLCHEYLPLYFSRRHGDPSRPWNRFSIRVKNNGGGQELNYEGNWRDIFQNWEALAASFPEFLPNMVAKFVNASTVDGFNPYRITREGVQWEVPSPEDPWSNIGYWGDHQIIYLLKLLEMMDRHDPDAIGDLLAREIFSYAEVPYRIRSYPEVLADTASTIDFDTRRALRIEERVARIGSDGKLLTDAEDRVYHANLLEKLLVPILAKLSNLIPDAGIWMNTQRPEWNDANNVLGGGGVSVVTLCYLRRHLDFLVERLTNAEVDSLPISREITDWFGRIEQALVECQGLVEAASMDARDRRRILDALGTAFGEYREAVYERGFSGKTEMALSRVIELFRKARAVLDWGIAANRRPDGLYHTYNQLEIGIDEGRVELVRLPEMLEGQVAVLSSGVLGPAEALELLERLFESSLYQPEQRSFTLYPDRELPGFLAKNHIPETSVDAIPLLGELIAAGEHSIVARDADGVCRFQGDLSSDDDLQEAMARLEGDERWADAIRRDRDAVLELFEDVFRHKSYTGRSGVMYGYEGLGCIYWHMVAKLLLAVQENCFRAQVEGQPKPVQEGLAEAYFRIRSGIGYEKTVEEYGAFPTDPYSHTPPGGGARQPGMTGQVKEEILTRIGELGVHVEDGRIDFRLGLLRSKELLKEPGEFHYFDVHGDARSIQLPARSLAFTLCQVPIVYDAGATESGMRIDFADAPSSEIAGHTLDARLSSELFSRTGRVERIRVGIPLQQFLSD